MSVSERHSLSLLSLLMLVVAVAVGTIAIGTTYFGALAERRASLAEAAAVQANLIAHHDEAARLPGEEVHRLYRTLGGKGFTLIGQRTGDTITYLENPWMSLPPPPPISIGAAEATPMLLALQGETGSSVVRDRHGEWLLVAYQPVSGSELGVIAEVDLSDIRAPMFAAAKLIGLVTLALVLAGGLLFRFLARGIIQRIDESATRFRALFENMRSGALVLQPQADGDDFRIIDLNRRGEQIQRADRRDVVGRFLSEVFPELAAAELGDMLRRVARSGASERLRPVSYRDKEGETWLEAYVYALPNADIVALLDDVSVRKRADDAMRESEARWRSIIEAHTQAIVIVDHEHAIRFVNRAAETLFGKMSAELLGLPFGFPIVQGERAEIELLRPGGRITFAEMQAVPMQWGGEEQFLVFLQDVSAVRRAEGDLRKLFQAIEQSPSSVVITDVDGRIEYVNPKFTEATGYTYPEVVGKNPRILQSGLAPTQDYEELWRTITQGKVWRGEFFNKKKNGELFWELAAIAPVRDVRGKITHYVAVKEDITERKATEERLRQSQKMETIGQLTGGLAHDFNNLLAIIMGNLQLLEEKRGLDRESCELLADALWSAERGAQLTHRLLAFARRQRLNPRAVDLNDVVSEMADLLRRTLGETIEIREVLKDDLGETMVDRGQLESALLNLVVNARDAMPSGGVLTITTDCVQLPQALGRVAPDVSPGEYVLLRVEDTGIGMPHEIQERIFEPFFTTKKFGEGSGLGLSMVYGFVRQSGGQIEVQSQLGHGTAIQIFLPKAQDRAQSKDSVSSHGSSDPVGRVVLVVEDDMQVRKTAASILLNQGYRVVEASRGREARRLIEELPQVDLLFADVVLPDEISGADLAADLLSRRPEAQVLLTSGCAIAASTLGRDQEHHFELLPKPYNRHELLIKVRELLGSSGIDQP